MKTPFRILHLEDSWEDSELVRRMLLSEGIECEIIRCENREKFVDKLEEKNFDLIFADCTVPQFTGLHALDMARQRMPEIPFIFVSGTIEEDSAIESLRSGATDYVLKSRLSRLVPAVKRAMAEAQEKAKSRDMEQRLRQAQRLEAVGTLAGGIAHDFNNILTIIKGFASLLPLESNDPARVQEIAGTIDRASQRGSELVNQLLAFARRNEGAFISTSLSSPAREVAAMLRPAFPSNVIFEFQLEENLPEITADAGQIERALINLATNARDAMPDGGKIIFSTGRVAKDQVPGAPERNADEFLFIRVTDTGCGMDAATVQRIFEPFFTTKPRGKGTGLGMPVVYGLMQTHNGHVDVKSEVGKGTAVALYFPLVDQPAFSPDARPAESKPSVEGTETVLLVDDEADVRQFLEVLLSMNGYRVISACDAKEALNNMPRPGELDLLFSDIGLPTIDGFELNRQIRQIQPKVKTILCSGYTDGKLQARMTQEGIDGFVPKPYDLKDLLQTVRRVLNE
jgi:signal transduction histidine kinase